MTYPDKVVALAAGETDANAYGFTEWRQVNGDYRATMDVAAAAFDEGELLLEVVVRSGYCRDQPSVLLMHDGTTVRRVDINGGHRERGRAPRQETHIQGEPPPEFFEWLGDEPAFKVIPPGANPQPHEYERVFAAAAARMGINIAGVEWCDPPVEEQAR